MQTIKHNLNYPESAKNDNIEGVVCVSFIIDTLGNVCDIEVIKGLRNDLESESVRIVRLLKG